MPGKGKRGNGGISPPLRSAGLLVICFSLFASARQEPAPLRSASVPPDEEAALRNLAYEFFTAYANKELEPWMRLWSAKAPALAPRRKQAEQLFATHEKLEVVSLSIGKVTVEGEKASVRAAARPSSK